MAEVQQTKPKSQTMAKKKIDDDEEEDSPKVNKIIENKTEGAKVLVIACGQGGTRVGLSISQKFKCTEKNVYINTSYKDIEGLGEKDKTRVIKLGDEKVEGAGKDRFKAEALLKENQNLVLNQLIKYMTEEAYDFIFVVFSTSGGTGGGTGPKLTAIANSKPVMDKVNEKFGKTPLVYGVAALPDLSSNEGNLSFENTIQCLNDIKKFISNDTGRYILINNGYDTNYPKGQDRVKQLDQVNVAVATVLFRYICEYGTSRISNLDKADRYGALTTMGLHSFMTLDEVGNKSKFNPFFLPDGERVKRLCYEVPEVMENQVLSQIKQLGVLPDDTIHGLYDTSVNSNNGLIPVIGFHGFKNIDKVAEQYDRKLSMNFENSSRIESESIKGSTGLDRVVEEREMREREYGQHSSESLDDIFG
ncbi:MAG: hypothetical protein IJ772_05100 [Bacilli bacterium]|nr:hypothetical protein [Bacilli bacterium]